MNFNVFFSSLLSTKPSLSLCIFALLDIILPITSQNSNHHLSCGETKLRDAVRNGSSTGRECQFPPIGSEDSFFFPCGGRLGWCQTWDPMSLNVLKPAWMNLKIPHNKARTISVNLFHFTYSPHVMNILPFAAASDIPFSISSADSDSEDAKSIHQNPLVVCY